MYGLPGDPNSRRLNRNATETRVHCLWNHLIETASPATGSMIIWDTGEYSVLPYHPQIKEPETEDSVSDISEPSSKPDQELSENEKLRQAFQNRKIRLRLHGARLPPDYTITMRLTTQDNVVSGPAKTPRKRRRRTAPSVRREPSSTPSRSPSPSPDYHHRRTSSAAAVHVSKSFSTDTSKNEHRTDEAGSASASDEEDIDEMTRLTNAYPGAVNSVGSIHQRRWFITLDRLNSGFEPSTMGSESGRKSWTRKRTHDDNGELLGFEPFYVRGPEVERSVVTGRLAKEVLEDEGVEGFSRRRGWKPVLE
ncbi:hypothetical protein DTO271D3_4080 [Paecilomyces variotii]|nr:hypothetical protein DTO169E5_463 [Paecilomyces variotii]KAJ9315507.1 hypothetical protein DTO271D3_4080 [Paecilomyces variotii]